jgi:DNA-binding GntR family transcriptional regulator
MLTRPDLHDLAYDALKSRILNRELRPGQRLSAVALAEELGVSRTPVTLAIERLAREGLVRAVPRIGAFVAELTTKDVAEVFDVRLLIEPGAAELCLQNASAEHIARLRRLVDEMAELCVGDDYADYDALIVKDGEFHRGIMAGTGNALLLDLYDSVNVFVQIARIYYMHLRNAQTVRAQHEAIMVALERGDPAALRQAVADHILGVKAQVLRANAGTNAAS